jgi:acetylglutamate/LysW-gamma-L-alpha-aminoadipate kinase
VYIIKVGGGDTINVEGIVRDLANLDGPVLVVLGANAVRDDIAERLGTPKKTLTSVSGYESVFSDEQAMDAIMMAYAGLRCSRFVELCQQNNVNAVGLSGIDGRARIHRFLPGLCHGQDGRDVSTVMRKINHTA